MTTTAFRWLFLALVLVVSAANISDVSAGRASAKQLDTMLFEYSSSLRWNEFEAAWAFVDPVYREQNPLNDIERARFKFYQVSGYEVKSREYLGKQDYAQVVEIRLINRHTQVERVITEREHWRWDAKSKRWWLSSGLPRFNQD